MFLQVAQNELGNKADHTEIVRVLEKWADQEIEVASALMCTHGSSDPAYQW